MLVVPAFGGHASDHVVSTLLLSDVVRAQVIEHMRACLPREGVGLLSGVICQTGHIAERFYPGRNTDRSATRYTMHPDDVQAALSDMKRRSVEFAAVVHSHPCTPPAPSRTDLAEAVKPWALHVIVGLVPTTSVRAWRLEFDQQGRGVRFQEVSVAAAPRFPGGESTRTWCAGSRHPTTFG